MKTRIVMSTLLGAAALGLLTLGAPEAQAQVTGRIYLTKQQVSEDVKGAALRKALRKQRTSVLQKLSDADGWSAFGIAKLKFRPSQKLMKLAHNNGKIQLVIRKRIKRRWVRQKIGELDYTTRLPFVRFELSLSDQHKIPARKKTQLQLVIQNKRKRDIVLARTTFSLR